ncbi:MAG TPA: integrase core domain-containing protein [Ktedonosporobacter sp.]|nr:integrase core domain-containing protein [Ktedonosporobacter sp.]
MIHVGSEAPVAGIFPQRCVASCSVCRSNRVCARRISHKKMALWSAITDPTREECLNIHWPQSLEETKRVTEQFMQHYNELRPHQGRACANRPPRQAFPQLPSLPPLPETVQADRWLWRYHHRAFVRLVGSDGCVTVHHQTRLPSPITGQDSRSH